MSQATIQNSARRKSSVEDRHVKTSRSQESKKALSKASDQASGLNNYESIKSQEQLSLFGKMSAAHYGTDLEKFSGAYPASGVMQSGRLSAHPRLAHRIVEIEFSLLPTPQAYSFQESHRPGQTKLDVKLRSLLPTPSVCGNHNRKGASKKSVDGLVTALQKLLPTPMASDGKSAYLEAKRIASGRQLNLETTIKTLQPLAPGQVLNPQFVEFLMGFPIGWTELAH
jgi:hypothetical protein